jgi:hypothetical protein
MKVCNILHRVSVAAAVLVLFGCAHTVPSVPAAPDTGPSGPDISFPAMRVEVAADFPLSPPVFQPYDLTKLRVGMSKNEVIVLFAKPKNTKRTPKDEYWEYTWFELYFREGRLVNWFNL